jgi:hypothetical protein
MTNDTRVTLTEAELQAFSRKLDAWAGSLSAREQLFLQQMLADAADAANEDMSGYAFLPDGEEDGEVQGYAFGMVAESSLGDSITTYAQGLTRAEEELATVFSTDNP